ncbi:MAG: alanine racemase [Calditrichaeota bacterium]|nr:alanine racemase [Calditrichota bacterium]MCB9365597.1 alanine racemase [Calditrichota bacterium]
MNEAHHIFADSRIEVSAAALQSNLKLLKQLIGPKVEFCSVVKGNAYGHGFEQFIPLAERFGVRWFAVYSADEAQAVRQHSTKNSEVMVMGGLSDEQLEWAIAEGVTFYVFNPEILNTAVKLAKRLGKRARIHLELETGMNRLGFEQSEMNGAVTIIKEAAEHLELVGLCTHFAGAESVANHLRIQEQIQTFETQVSWLASEGLTPRFRHAASSAATFTYPETRYDLVRVGIAQYGFWPSLETKMNYLLSSNGGTQKSHSRDPLTRVMRWSSRVMNIKDVLPGKFVGYGTSHITTRKSRLAAVPVGYFHGYNRNLSNLGHVLIRGKRATVAGVVNMNLMLVDVTDIKDAEAGDEVVLIGKQKREEITVGAFSDLTRLLNYEALVRLSPNILREVV